MSYFDDASLVMIPSGYKTSKVYSVKPTDGTGDLTFSRSNDTATRVNSAGLIEKVRTNLILQSQAFDNASWDKITTTVTANSTANPLTGAVDADTITFTGGTTQKFVAQVISMNGNYTISVYLKAGTHQFAQILLGTDATPYANFDLVNGTSNASGSTATITSVSGGWYRCSMSFSTSTGNSVFILASDSLSTLRFQPTSSTGTLIAFGYQLETGDIATQYIPTLASAVSVGPVANVPRLDYLGSSCPRLLLEPQRTNLALYSEQFGNAAWTAFNASISSNASATLDPQGYYGADKLVENSSSAFHDADQVQTYSAAAHTISVFAKAAGRNHIFLQHFDGTTFFTSGTFNLANGTVSGSGSIVSYGNGWYRCSFTATTASGTGKCYINLSNGTSGNYQGDGTSGVYLWGAQLEAGAYATSYIPTITATTRGADAASKTSASALIGQTEGTVFGELEKVGGDAENLLVWMRTGATSYNEMIQVGINTSGSAIVSVRSSSTNQFVAGSSVLSSGTHKIALAYKANDFAFYVDGVQVATSSSGSVPTCDQVYLAGYPDGGVRISKTKQFLLFTTRLSNADLAALTA